MKGYDYKMEKSLSEFEEILKQAKELVGSDSSVEQAVAVKTSKGHTICFANHSVISGNTTDEEAFVKSLRESGDTKIRYAVCMWSDSALDVPSHHLSDLLVNLNPSNQEAEFLLSSGEGFIVKLLKSLRAAKGRLQA